MAFIGNLASRLSLTGGTGDKGDSSSKATSPKDPASTSTISLATPAEYQRKMPVSQAKFVDHFWGKDDNGLDALVQRMRSSKHTMEEVLDMVSSRALLEEEYGKKLLRLSAKNFGKEELGTMKGSLDVIRDEFELTGKSHLDLANSLRAEIEKPLSEFLATQSTVRKSHLHPCEKSLKSKAALYSNVQKSREKYESKCVEANALMASRTGAPAKELDKIRSKLDKVLSQVKAADIEYQRAVETLKEASVRWEEEFTTACNQCQVLEEDRIDHLRTQLWGLSNAISTVCVAVDESCERMRQSLEKCDVDTDIKEICSKGPGPERPRLPEYVNFYTLTSQSPSSSGAPAQPVEANSFAPRTFAGPPPNNAYGQWSQAPAPARPGLSTAQLQQQHQQYRQSANAPLGPTQPYHPAPSAFSSTASSVPAAAAAGGGQKAAGPPGGPAESGLFVDYDPWSVDDKAPTLFKIRVLYDYVAQAPEELSIKAGQVLPVLATQDDGWWEGVGTGIWKDGSNRKRKGLFPSNFCEAIS